MLQTIEQEHHESGAGMPAGGHTTACGLDILWQNGPLGRGEERQEPNGAFVETVIAAAKGRLEHYERTRFKCKENEDALSFLNLALNALARRTADREKRGVEGTHWR